MAQYTKTELLDAYCRATGYTDKISDVVDGVEVLIDNPETKVQHHQRTSKERGARIARRQLESESSVEARLQVRSKTENVSL